MRPARHIPFIAVCVFTAAVCGCNQPPGASPTGSPAPAAVPPAQSSVERGRALVSTGVCNDCHTPKKYGPKGSELDTERILSGHREGTKITAPFTPVPGSPWTVATSDDFTAWSGPWGISFAANLTPDTLTGLRSGVWTEELFVKAMRSGKHMGTSRDILPPMPWQEYGKLGDDDLKAIWAYLGSIPAVTNHVPDPIPPAGAATSR